MVNTVRIQEIQIENFKNVEHGKIFFDSYKTGGVYSDSYRADILGLYGQNGSGKTSMVESIDILKVILSGDELDKNVKQLISYNTQASAFKFTFTIQIDENKYMVYYSFKLRNKEGEEKAEIYEEVLKYADINIKDRKISSAKSIIEFNMDEKSNNIFSPISTYNLVRKLNEDVKTDLIVYKKLAKEKGTSFIFNNNSMDIFEKIFTDKYRLYSKIIKSLHNYAIATFVIKNDYLEHIDLSAIMPFNFMINIKDGLAKGMFMVALFNPHVIDIRGFDLLSNVINQINIVLTSLIPGLTLEIKTIREELLEDGEIGKAFELLSVRGDVKIPLKYESDGIKKIISILSGLIAMYNNEKVCIVIDELDSGIFEFLLGELLTVLKEKGKGQLIFTSHNLRALEVLDKNDITFTTTNPKNRYIKLKNVRKTNNLRDLYLREIFLGEQKEPIYSKTKSYAISRAFRKAGISNE